MVWKREIERNKDGFVLSPSSIGVCSVTVKRERIICVCPAVVNHGRRLTSLRRYQLEEKLKHEHHRRPVKPSRQLFHPLLVHDLKAS